MTSYAAGNVAGRLAGPKKEEKENILIEVYTHFSKMETKADN